MARKKRSFRGLSGSMKHHEEYAEIAAEHAYKMFKKAIAQSDADDCGQAQASILRATHFIGSMEAHTDEPTRRFQPAHRADALNEEMKAFSAFRRNCMVSTKLSGLGRRPARRR